MTARENAGMVLHLFGEDDPSHRAARKAAADVKWLADRVDAADLHISKLLRMVERSDERAARYEEALRKIEETARWYADNGQRLPLEVDHALCVEVLSYAEAVLPVGAADTNE